MLRKHITLVNQSRNWGAPQVLVSLLNSKSNIKSLFRLTKKYSHGLEPPRSVETLLNVKLLFRKSFLGIFICSTNNGILGSWYLFLTQNAVRRGAMVSPFVKSSPLLSQRVFLNLHVLNCQRKVRFTFLNPCIPDVFQILVYII